MIFLLLGAASLVAVMAALGMFSKAQVTTIKSFGLWIVGIGGLLLAAMLFLTGRGGIAIAALLLLGLLVWSWMQEPGQIPKLVPPNLPRWWPRGVFQRPRDPPPRRPRGAMSRDEAYAVLGLRPGANAEAVRAAHRRLMRIAHPDSGGSDWLAARINQARDVLLG